MHKSYMKSQFFTNYYLRERLTRCGFLSFFLKNLCVPCVLCGSFFYSRSAPWIVTAHNRRITISRPNSVSATATRIGSGSSSTR